MTRPARLAEREFRRILGVVLPALAAADRITLGWQRRVAIKRKRDGSEVTAADRAAERLLRQRLRAAWPADPVLGEEYGGELADHGRCWLVDPIDGTSSYVLGLGTFGTLLALVVDGEPVFGCIHLPAMHETTYAGAGRGCWLQRPGQRARRVRVRAARSIAAAETGLTSYKASDLLRRPGPWRLSGLARTIGRVRLVGDCVQYALLCRGELDAAVDPLMNPWDIAPLMRCVLEAGGSVGDLGGATRGVLRSRSFVAASSPALRRAICRSVAPSRRR
ncbi:MAG: inositol phosphatase [Proteobacteria bacterium]|nr:inositol phosphatase [Pseudomonadota bacterium]